MERIFEESPEDEDQEATEPTEALVQSLQQLQPLFQLVHKLGLRSTAEVLRMPEVETVR
jgi:hypothetical protein